MRTYTLQEIREAGAGTKTADTAEPVNSALHIAEDEQCTTGKLAGIMRAAGSLALIAAAIAFILQNWDGFNAIQRYLSFLGFTSVLAVVGFFCGIKIRETKGARTFLGLAAAIIPAHFLQLGALNYSLFVNVKGKIPEFFLFQAYSASTVVVTTAVAIVTLAAVAFAAFSVLARPYAKQLTMQYMLLNLLLLVPSRTPAIVGFILLVSAGVALVVEHRLYRRQITFQTTEGRVSRLFMAVPVLLLAIRNMFLYDFTAGLATVVFSLAASTLFVVSKNFSGNGPVARALQLTAVPLYGFAALAFTELLIDLGVLTNGIAVPAATLSFSGCLLVLSRFAENDGRGCRASAAVIANAGMLIHMLGAQSGLPAASFAAGIAVLTFAASYLAQHRFALVIGALSFSVSILYHLSYAANYALTLYRFSPWFSLALIGVGTILAASYLERYGAALRHYVKAARCEIGAWK